MYAGLSEEGRTRVPEEFFTRWAGVHSMRVLICGDPAAPPYQIILTGNAPQPAARRQEPRRRGLWRAAGLRRPARKRAAGLPGNLYRDQFLLAQRLLRNLDAAKRKLAVLEEAPVQTGIELQGTAGIIPWRSPLRARARGQGAGAELVERIFATYPPDDVAYARACLQANGGLDAAFPQLLSARRRRRDCRRSGLSTGRTRRRFSISVDILMCTRSSTSPWMETRRCHRGTRSAKTPPGWIGLE